MEKLPDKQGKTGDPESSLTYRKMRRDKKRNLIAVRNAYVKWKEENEGWVTYKVLAEMSGVSIRTVKRHFKTINFNPVDSNSKKSIREQIFEMFSIEI